MLFHNLAFFLLFPFAVAATRMRISWQARKWILVFLSYFVVFYTAWEPLFVGLVVALTCIDWTVGRKIATARTKGQRKFFLICSLSVNLGLLGYYKFHDFLLDNLSGLAHVIGLDLEVNTASVAIPLGISFYTFQSLSYTIDVYRGRPPCESFVDYALFLAFFPRFVAGPIVRANQFLPQCEAPPTIDLERFCSGLSLIIVGVFAKLELADRVLRPVVDRVFAAALSDGVGLFNVWTGILAYPCQLFFDFAGYSMAAIGAARCLGFDLPQNFNLPFAAQSVTEFWRRWHISLSMWIRDYVYMPLTMWFAKRTRRVPAGRARDMLRPAGSFAAVVITMGLMGLWHGALWTMVLYGIGHGLVLTVEALRERSRRTKLPDPRPRTKIHAIVATYVIVSLLLVLFRSARIQDALTIWHHAVGAAAMLVSPDDLFPSLIVAAIVPCVTVAVHVLGRNSNFESLWSSCPPVVTGLLLGFMLFVLSLYHGGGNGFIYAGF
ncbi:MAG: hypothetical protein JWO36_1268 [Myxococcales bacterium]|nr:hypothetical protein [Myxococcales bacterium]